MTYNIVMGKSISGRRAGMANFIEAARYPSRSVVSDADIHFTKELAKNESEQENISGLVSNKIIIRNVAINSVQALHFRLEFYSKDSFTDSDLNEDTFIGAVDLDLTKYGELA